MNDKLMNFQIRPYSKAHLLCRVASLYRAPLLSVPRLSVPRLSVLLAAIYTVAFALPMTSLAETTKTVHLTVMVDDPGAHINRDIYGQFVEHLGRGVYEGLWVGKKSKIKNKNGLRTDVVEALKDLQVPLLRWPGGCFADQYHWQDGIGPQKKRPKGINFAWGDAPETNAFGTHEFFELADQLGAEVYINGNLGTGTSREMADWLEYMTGSGESTLVNLRKKNGREDPWKVKYFAMGNESWGCGGTMRPQYYADLYKHFATFLKTPADNTPIYIASGGYNDVTEWTETLLKEIPQTWSLKMDGISHHYYTVPTGQWEKKGNSTGFDEAEWHSTFVETRKIEDYIQENLAIMDKMDPEKKLGFFVDEWGTWYDPDEGQSGSSLYQQNTIRDALVAAVNLNIFHQYAERVRMTNIAQMVNVLQAMILTDSEKMVLTPTYHVYRLYVPFQGATNLPVQLSQNPTYQIKDKVTPQLSVSAAQTEKGRVILALTNVHPEESVSVELDKRWKKATGDVLTAIELDSRNTFSTPDKVKPKAISAQKGSSGLVLVIPPKSVSVVELR